jgi:ABC-2 type transport system permease protein
LNIDYFSVSVILFISLVGLYGFGFMLAGITLILKRIGQVAFLIQVILLFFIMAPMEIIPKSLYFVFSLLPLVKGINLIKTVMTNHISLLQISSADWLNLIVVSLIYLSIGILVYMLCDNHARKNNLIGQY